MKILSADYDGTIIKNKTKLNGLDKIILNKNTKSINDFMDKGNIFVINTGRDYESIKRQLETNQINYNYLIYLNGVIAKDNKGKLIFKHTLDEGLKEFVRIFYKSKLCSEFNLYDENGITDNIDEAVLATFKINDHYVIDYLRCLKSDGVKMKYVYYDYEKKMYLTIRKNKSSGLKDLIKQENIECDNKDIYTIGNDNNDYEMLKDYNGYMIPTSSPSLYLKKDNIKITPSVHRLIKKINK